MNRTAHSDAPVFPRPSRWWYLVFAFAIGALIFSMNGEDARPLLFSEFRDALQKGRVVGPVVIGEHAIQAKIREREGPVPFVTQPPPGYDVVPLIEAAKLPYTGAHESQWNGLVPLMIACVLLLGVFWFIAMRRGGSAPVSALPFSRHRAQIHSEKDTMVTFKDVAGIDEAVEEVQEIVEYLRHPGRFQALGGRVPRGLLLVGLPGTGKTLLARAVAGEASVPFLSLSGADFVEMYAGVGAARVRSLFGKAREIAPCIIFIDELDALGKMRTGSMSGGSDEREQTLNQLLVAMDGFSQNAGVIVLAATNRPEILDPALLRAGRFDRRVVVDRPDIRGRLQILRLQTRNIKLGRNVDLAVAARRTAGYTGADLATIVNEAALLAARRRRDQVGMAHFEEAIDRVMAGLERRSRLIGRREKALVAVHECGHAMITSLVPHADPLHRVSVIPRGVGIGGMTLQLPREERGMMTRAELYDRVAVLLAGRCAEDIVFGDVSTGAAQDLQQATEIAYRMVAEYGMSDRIGPLSVARADRPLLMHERTKERALGDETAREIDVEVRRILLEQDERVRKLLGEHRRRLVALARVLRDRETLDAKAFANLMNAPLKKKAKANPAL